MRIAKIKWAMPHCYALIFFIIILVALLGNDSNLLIVFYVQIMPDDFVMQLHRF
ncbi:mfs superfamily major facilitator transporter [Klebsiella pneumoniae]|nr:mfs superfamily major facilitator transporter [Klebsiella pneumoniae]